MTKTPPKTTRRFALYSIGPNLRDDGGTTNEEGYADEDEGDLIWAGHGSARKRKRPQY